MRIVWAGQTAAAVIFLGVLLQLRATGNVGSEVEPVIYYSMAGVSVVVLVVSVVLPRFLLTSFAKQQKPAIEEELVEEEALFRQAPKKRRVFAKPDAARSSACAAWFTPFVLGMAFAESIVLFGLVLGIMGFGLLEVLPFYVVGWILVGIRFPRQRPIEAAFEKAHDAVFPADRG